ncbi:MAG: hypothetical protein RSB72_00735, partial [Bacilli bacterium]
MEKKSIIAFNNYIANFDLNNQKINDKYHHSISVMNLSYDLAQHLKLKKSDCNIARIIDLIHGYGRFDQLTKYDSYDDFENIDHGDYGVQLLFAENLIKNYKVNLKKY